MITQALIDEVEGFARQQAEQYHLPPFLQTAFILKQGQRLAKHRGADPDIVTIGVHLMDAMLGKAVAESKREAHIQWAVDNTQSMLVKHASLTKSETQNVLACIREHHGIATFYSIESEICCNADCYRFLSVQGLMLGLLHGRKMPIENLVKLYKEKVKEKWNALTFTECREELLSQHNAIKAFLEAYS